MDKKLQERLRRLYDNASVYLSLPDYDTFVEDMKDYDKLSRLRDNMLEHYSMPPMEQVALDFGVKKKESLQVISQEEGMDLPMENTLSDVSKIIEKDEVDAIVDVNNLLAGKGFSVQETGIGDALSIIDNVTGEETEIDLQPINWFGNTKYKEAETKKLLDLVNSKNNLKRRAVSDNNLSDFVEDKGNYLNKLKTDLPQFSFEQTADGLQISKGDVTQTFDFFMGQGTGLSESEKFSKINKFILDNINEKEASDIYKNKSSRVFEKNIKEIDAIKNSIDISDEEISKDIYNKDYFKKLFTRLEADGININPEAKAELEEGVKQVTNPKTNTTRLISFNENDINSGIDKYFSDNTNALEVIKNFNKDVKNSVLSDKIKKATQLKIEQYYDTLPNRESVRQLVIQKNKDIKSEEADIMTNLELAKQDYLGMFSYGTGKLSNIVKANPGLDVKINYDISSNKVSISSSEKNAEIPLLEKELNNRINDFEKLIKKSEIELNEINSNNSNIESFLNASNRNYNNIDIAYADLKNAAKGMAADFAIIESLIKEGVGLDGISGIPEEMVRASISKEKQEDIDRVSKFYETKMQYNEVGGIGDLFVFALRELATQTPNITLAMATAGAGASLNLSKAAISTLVSTQFGVTSAGAKYDELTTRQKYGEIAKKGLKELEIIKDNISTQEYLDQKFELERAIEDSKITSKQKTAAVLATGAIEFGISRFIGTVPNSISVLKNLKKPGQFLDDILMSNKKSVLNKLGGAGTKVAKATGGEIVEEESIEILGQLSNFAILGDKVDFSNLDDVLVTSIITSGAMNVPGTAYSTILTNINNKKYNSKVDANISKINELKKLLRNPELKEANRKSIHSSITKEIINIANVANELEADALLVGAEDIKELLVMSDVERSLNEKAGITSQDSEQIKEAKRKAHINSLDSEEGKQYQDNLNYIETKRNEVLGELNYDTAIEDVFGEQGKEIAEELDEKLSPKEKYTKVYEAIKDDINKESVKEYVKLKEVRDFANRMDENPDALTDDDLNFYSENKAVVDKVITERKEQRKQEQLNDLAIKFTLDVDSLTESESKLYEDNKEFIDKKVESIKEINPDIVTQAMLAKRSLSGVFSDVTIKLYDSEQKYAEDTGEVVGNTSSGEYNIDKKEIRINLQKATSTTVPHEVFHAVLLSKGISDSQAKKIADAMVKSVSKVASKKLNKKITDFSKKYSVALQSEESMAELFGILASEYKSLSKPDQNIIKRFLDKLAKLFGLKQFTDTEVVDLLNVLSKKINYGQTIKSEDINILNNETRKKREVQSERTGDGVGRNQSREIKALEGSPIIQGATGPDVNLVKVADKYAKDNGIDLKRQSEYVLVDEERAKRIADAYEEMANEPQNPKVKEAYQNLINQTKKQYDALIDSGYEFTFFDDKTDPYKSNPYNAMRDLRKNKRMAVFGTFAGYGTEGITDSEIKNNPLLVDTGLRWKDQKGQEQIVTANDLFRAVHDAFGHGLEGSGFRARGEENAWQAHVRLFTGSAVAAITTETRGQNSWLNYGPFGEQNRNAKVEDTVFAEQKIGLLPDWTLSEGLAGDFDTTSRDRGQTFFNEGKIINSPISTISRKQVGAFDVQYTEDKRREELIKEGLIVEQENLNSFGGNKAAITSPDDMLAGTISINGKQIFEGGGGVFFVTKYGDVWASGNEGTANTLKRSINSALKENGGKGYLVLAKGSDSKLISSASGVNSSLAVLESMLTEGLISPEIFRESTIEGIDKFKTDTSKKAVISLKRKEAIAKAEEKKGRKLTDEEKNKLPKQKVTDQEVQKYIDAEFSDSISLTPNGSASVFIKELNAYFKNPKSSTFVMRGDVLRNIISGIAKKIPAKNKQKVVDFLGGDTNKSVGVGSTDKSQALVDLVTGVASEKLTKGLSSGDVYAVIEVNDEVEIVEDSHPSYPYHIRTKSGKPILHLPKQRDNGSKIFLTKKGNPYKVTQVSVMSGEFVEAKPQEGRSRKQTFLTEGVNKALKEKASKKNKVKLSRIIREKTLDRQTRIKDLLKGIGSKESQRAHDLLVTKAGASGNASLRVKEAKDKIYKGLSKSDIVDLNEVIYLKRIISINKNRRKNKRPPYVGYKGINSTSAGGLLNTIKAQVGTEKFNTLKERADTYFEVFNESLKRMYDAQLISEDVYNKLKEEEYSPIKTIKYLIPDNINDTEVSRMSEITGLSPDAIKTLSNENKNEIILDSEWLLQSNISMMESRVFENRLLNSFFDAYNELSKEDKDAFSNIIKDNPVVGKTDSGKPKYQYDKAPKGFTKLEFVKDGVKKSIIMDQAYANQLLDIKKDQGKLSKNLKVISGVNILRFMATSGNPLFIVGNTAVDFSNILLLSNTYSNNKFVAAPELAYDFIKNSLKKGFGTKEYKEIYKEFVEHGGSLDFLSSDGLRSIQGIKSDKFLVNATTAAMKGIGGLLSYLGETSELSFRLAVYEKAKANNIKKFEKENGEKPTDKEMEDIMFASARESRETIDFNQGGTVIKQFDQVFPYLNAATQGFRKGVDFASENPKQFASNILQSMIMAGGIAAAGLVMLFRGLDDEDDVEEIFKSISTYEKANYHIIFTGRKDEEGEFEYIRIKKLPLLSVTTTMAEQLVIKEMLKSRGIKYDFNSDMFLDNIESSLPFVPTGRNILSRNPFVASLVAGFANYDLFYDKSIFENPRNLKLQDRAKGADDERVANIYKDLGDKFDFSPKIAQSAVEKVITSETTNPLVGLFYSGYDKMFKEEVELGKELDGVIDRVVKNSKRKVLRTTNKKLIGYAENELLEIEEMGIETEIYRKENKIKKAIKNNELTQIQLRDLIVENFEPIDYERYWKKFTTYARSKDIDYSILDIIYEQNPKVQGLKIYRKFGDDFDEKEKKALIKVFSIAKRKWSKKGLYYYNKIKLKKGE